MKYVAACIAAAVGLASAFGANGQPLAAAPQEFVPRLGDIMAQTQLRHIKLWYAGKERNWGLANYELEQIKYTFDDAMKYYPGLKATDMTAMEKPAAQIDAAIKAKNRAKFTKAFEQLTDTCDSCHRAQGYGFIVITVPTASPFSNELFRPK